MVTCQLYDYLKRPSFRHRSQHGRTPQCGKHSCSRTDLLFSQWWRRDCCASSNSARPLVVSEQAFASRQDRDERHCRKEQASRSRPNTMCTAQLVQFARCHGASTELRPCTGDAQRHILIKSSSVPINLLSHRLMAKFILPQLLDCSGFAPKAVVSW